MLAWLFWPLDRIERIHAVASSLIRDLGPEAHAEARRRESEAESRRMAQEWGRVAAVVARRTVKQTGDEPALKAAPIDMGLRSEPALIAPGQAHPFRIQFVCGTVEWGPTNLTEKRIHAADASAAIVAAANTRWPPQTIGLRILDQEGREVFARAKGRR